jgi:hypothetical protein
MEAHMGHTMQMLVISGTMLVLLVIAGLTNPVLTYYPSKDAARISDLNIRTEANGDSLDLALILSGGASYHKQ